MYLKTLGFHVYLATTNNAYSLDGKNFEANSKALHALKSTLDDVYLSRVSNNPHLPWRKRLILCGERFGCWKRHLQQVLYGPRG